MANTDASASFAIELEDGTSGAANAAANALQTLRGQIDGDTKALAAMQRAMKNLQGGTVVNVQQFKALQAGIAAKRGAIAEAQSSFIALGGTFAKTGGGTKALESRFAAMIEQSKGMPGPLGMLVAKFQALSKAVGGGAIALGLVGIVAGLALLVAATAKAIASLYHYGIAQADARRSELLRLEGMTKLRNYWGVAAGNAADMQQAIDQVSASSALGRDRIAAYSDQLYKMHLRGANLTAALEGVAMKASVQGDAQASMFAQWAAGANMTGQSVKRLADDVKARLGGIAAAQMLSLTVQAEKQHESFAALFSGLKIEAFLKGQAAVKGLLSQSTNSGKALKAILTTMLQPLIDAATKAQPIIKRFFQGMIIGALRIGIALLEVRNWFLRTFGAPDVLKGFDKQNAALLVGEATVGLLAAGLGVASVAAAALSVKLTAMLIPALWGLVRGAGALALEGLVIAAPFLLAAAAIFAVINTGRLLYQLWQEIDWKGLGTSMWQGITAGLKSGAKWVQNAAKSLAKSVTASFKEALGISSPSRVFARLGIAIPMGIGMGVQAGAPMARRQVADIIQPTFPRLGQSGAQGGAGEQSRGAIGGNTSSVQIGEIHVHAPTSDPQGMAAAFKDELARVLEGVAIQLGAAAPDGAT